MPCLFFRSLGKHVQKSVKGDLAKIVNELISNKAFHQTPDRKYHHYAQVKPSILCGFDMQKMFHWIDDHKSIFYIAVIISFCFILT